MNWKTLPDCPEHLKHWSGHDPADPPAAFEEDDPRIDCDCGHKGFKEEVTLVDGRTVCCNCMARNGRRHCWKDWREWLEESGKTGSEAWVRAHWQNATCLLPEGHDGSHEWTTDSDITVRILQSPNVEAEPPPEL